MSEEPQVQGTRVGIFHGGMSEALERQPSGETPMKNETVLPDKIVRHIDKRLREEGYVAEDEEVVYVDSQPGYGPCVKCGKTDELRYGWCYPCFAKDKAMLEAKL